MKNIAVVFLLFISAQGFAQSPPTKHYTSFELGNGLNFAFNDSAYLFRISGMVQPYIGFDKMPDQDANRYLNSRRTYLNFGGYAMKERIEFFLQLDYSLTQPLLDAWVAYHPNSKSTITLGQKQNLGNNREMLIMEDKLQFPDRSLVSIEYSLSGREFGLFAEYRFGENFGVVPMASVTSGDGRNSFGTDSRDTDIGGFKYSGRVDVYPLGYFSEGNDQLVADLQHEESIKLVVGGAASFNDGASQAVGEGHGNFMLYNSVGDLQQPDYRQVYGDILIKYMGFSFLGEYNVSTATNLEGTYKTETASDILLPTEISEYLALGTGYNLQLGYVTRSGYALDFRYSSITPEFDQNLNSVTQEKNGWTLGFSKYFKDNDLKIQTAFTSLEYGNGTEMIIGELLFQVVF